MVAAYTSSLFLFAGIVDNCINFLPRINDTTTQGMRGKSETGDTGERYTVQCTLYIYVKLGIISQIFVTKV
jgi:hypothetical protein